MAITATETPPSAGAQLQPIRVALWLAAQGIHVHPLLPGKKIPPRGCDRCWRGTKENPNPSYISHDAHECPCLVAGRYCHGVLAATTDVATIQNWWEIMPQAGVGVATGKSGLLILDIDRHGSERPASEHLLPGVPLPADVDVATLWNGEDVLALLCELRNVDMPTANDSTMTIRTPSGGLQAWFRVPRSAAWMPSAGKLGWQLDVRAGHSYGIAPGTVTAKGPYAAVGSCRTIADLPGWLASDLERTGHLRVQPDRRPVAGWTPPRLAGGQGYVAAALRGELEKVAAASDGQRSVTLNSSSYALGQFVGAGLLSREAVHEALTQAAAAAGVDPAERKAQDTIRRGLDAGERSPRRIEARR